MGTGWQSHRYIGRFLRSLPHGMDQTRRSRELPGFRQVARLGLYVRVPVGRGETMGRPSPRHRCRAFRLENGRFSDFRGYSGAVGTAGVPERL